MHWPVQYILTILAGYVTELTSLILCCHILSVFLHKDCYHIPPLYLPSRWCCEASLSEKELLVLDDENLEGKENVFDANVNGVIDGDCFINCPPLSKTRPSKSKTNEGQKRIRKAKEDLWPLQACWS